MKNWKKYMSLLLALIMCLSLMACGGDSGSSDGDVAPATIEGLVMDDSVECDYSGFWGTWLGEDGSVLLVEEYTDRTRFDLSDGDELLASGELQYVEEYGYVYAYNEHDGMAHQCWFDENNALHIDAFGTFTQMSGDMPDDTDGDVAADYSELLGTWYLDGAAEAASSLEFDEHGNWTLYERPGGDGDPTEVDCGTVSAGGEDGLYYATSTLFEDVVYDFTVVDDNTMYWGGEYDCYIRV